MSALLEGLKSLGVARLTAMGGVALALFGLLAVLALHGGTERMALLYADLDPREAGQIAETLERQHIPHQTNAAGSEILVPADQVAHARLLLAKDGLPSGGSIGYEIFDRADSLTANQFQQAMNQARALEGELSRTIRGIAGIRAARVHLVLPKREPFARDRQEAQAAVMLTSAGAGRLDRESVQAILNLVAAAVPGLRPQNVSVVDSRGNLLARAGEPTGPAAAAQSVEEIRRGTEQRLSRAVEEMLESSLGPGRVRAEIAVDMDFEQLRETQEKYDPDGQVVRSAQNVTSSSKTTEQAGTVSVQNNLPNADAGGNPAGSQEQRQEETTNYEIGKTVRTMVREQPQIRRISLAVMVDGTETRAADGAARWQERTPEELERIGRLVRSAIGFDEKRGDRVEVVTMRFVNPAAEAGPEPRGILGIPIERADVMRLVQTALFGVFGLLALLLVLRPMMLRLAAVPGPVAIGPDGVPMLSAPMLSAAGMLAGGMAPGAAGLALAGGGGPGGGPALLEGPGGAGGSASGPGGGGEIAVADEGRMINMANVEGQLRASSLRRIAELVEKHPQESLAIVRGWMQREAA